jgi:UPF0716 protein FxsA
VPILLLFVVLPIIELLVIGEVQDVIGWGWTLLVLFGDGLIGAVLVRSQSRKTWHNFRTALAARHWPGDEVAQGALVLVGGALVVTPGFVTDTVGLLCLVPISRRAIAAGIRRRLVPLQGFGSAADSRRERGHDPRRGETFAVEVVSVEVEDEDRDSSSDPDGPTP